MWPQVPKISLRNGQPILQISLGQYNHCSDYNLYSQAQPSFKDSKLYS